MPWNCPACHSRIRHDADLPAQHQIYRCHICRLELVYDAWTQKLIVAPLSKEHAATVIGGRRSD